ncbi:hypothetical protein GSI_09482 [Ganoderma sinense ZZ0214-1]|uniref:Hypervirulence associated protein TUDOR domain-containing protein n=1 Tax=Ganoderma sinense ZZ0214-1 TaxID=1077348 RepID=A0A2G8S3I8_9APHY|nr:hypothetical protein GSI_09482 [Ganoderma sinense ZZ0214-1]
MPVRVFPTTQGWVRDRPFKKGEKDKEGRVINVGDLVETKFRGGVHRGVVEAVIENQQDLEEMGPDLGVTIKKLPKIIYTDQVSATQ